VPESLQKQIMEYLHHWSAKTSVSALSLWRSLGLSSSKFYQWQHAGALPSRGLTDLRKAKARVVPRAHWISAQERAAIIAYAQLWPLEGYRRLSFMMLDAGVASVSPSTTYRVLKHAGLIGARSTKAGKKGTGFEQPLRAHEHWHLDITYLNLGGTYYYLLAVLDGYSRALIHWEIHLTMKNDQVQLALQRAQERYPNERPRLITDNGPQFIAKDFKEFVRLAGLTHVKTSPYYPQSNGKMERWFGTAKNECLRPAQPSTPEEARTLVSGYVTHYNEVRLHSSIGYVAPQARLEGRDQLIQTERQTKLANARLLRHSSHQPNQPEKQLNQTNLPLNSLAS
jgi:putative transposase